MDDVSTLIITYQPQPRMFSDLSGQTKNTAGRYGLGALAASGDSFGVGTRRVRSQEVVCDLRRSQAQSPFTQTLRLLASIHTTGIYGGPHLRSL